MTQDTIQDLFLELVAIPSESGQEQEIITYIQTFLKQRNISSKPSKQQSGLVATLPATDETTEKAPIIAFSAHVDTATTPAAPKITLTNGYIETTNQALLGADDKAGVTAMLAAIDQLTQNPEPHGQIEFIFTTKEEEGLTGAKLFDLDLVEADFGFCLDAPGPVGSMIRTSRTHLQLDFWIEVGESHDKSAIQIAREALKKIHKHKFPTEMHWQVYHFGGEVLENGNEKVTILSELSADFPLEHCLPYVEQIKQIFIEIGVAHKADVQDVTHMNYHHFHLASTSKPCLIATQAMANLELPQQTVQLEGGTDANVFNDRGIPFLVLAAGYENPHTTSERIAVTELHHLTKLVAEIIKVTAN
ncbi:M20/M25/M40 family metallo-hydrolase [Listeria booriae]|uniref:M20/M25/M40 family metallo-hydrolase n=1 Tax=Listeria booriae TaxID=1552123 RepID=UPI00162A0CA1|nr:M20/M25/M40 family metallo-hydrolase [Listeria booriae]MBC1553620.1 M20/M25/M40 family metallo-hydrolase [Listeria booriae]